MQVATYQKFLSAMAKDLGCKIFSPNYRLAPETPYPIGDMDSYHATKHVFDNTKLYRLDKNKIAMSGDSAGGFLTVVTWFR
jgi:acetyl esterase/lipase